MKIETLASSWPDGHPCFLVPVPSAVIFLWPPEKLEDQLPCLPSCLSMLKEKPSGYGSNEDGKQIRNRRTELLKEEATVLRRVRKLVRRDEE